MKRDIVHALKILRCYLLGRKFILMTNQGDLTSQHHEPAPLTSRRGLKKG